MSEIVVSKAIFEQLVKHLVDIEEEKDLVIERYYSDPTQDKDEFEILISDYIKEVESYMLKAKVVEGIEHNTCPFVIIGSIVEVEDLKDREIEKFKIVSPFSHQGDIRSDYASYLSPIGKALLLKQMQEKVSIETPMGKINYQVKSIQLPPKVITVS